MTVIIIVNDDEPESDDTGKEPGTTPPTEIHPEEKVDTPLEENPFLLTEAYIGLYGGIVMESLRIRRQVQ